MLAIQLGGLAMTLLVRRHPRARRASLRISADGEVVIVVLPRHARLEDGVAIAREHAEWIRTRLQALPERVPFADGAVLPVHGRPRIIRHIRARRARVREEDNVLVVGGGSEGLPRHIEIWLRGEARRLMTERAGALSERLGHSPAHISIRDTRSSWGSCSSTGALSFSWRLILAPPEVLDYVVAHEMAHLAQRGHGPQFWRTVARLTEHMDAGRAWLRRHGRGLFRYG
jgi:predicted metal-dependent hydrolase